jgi:hypothetical protein
VDIASAAPSVDGEEEGDAGEGDAGDVDARARRRAGVGARARVGANTTTRIFVRARGVTRRRDDASTDRSRDARGGRRRRW